MYQPHINHIHGNPGNPNIYSPSSATKEVLSGVPLLFMSCLSLKVSAHGAALTEKCRAIPPFVNQIPTEAGYLCEVKVEETWLIQ